MPASRTAGSAEATSLSFAGSIFEVKTNILYLLGYLTVVTAPFIPPIGIQGAKLHAHSSFDFSRIFFIISLGLCIINIFFVFLNYFLYNFLSYFYLFLINYGLLIFIFVFTIMFLGTFERNDKEGLTIKSPSFSCILFLIFDNFHM